MGHHWRDAEGDLEGALQDYNEAIRLKPDYASAFNDRGNARRAKGDLGGRGGLQRGHPAGPDFAAVPSATGAACTATPKVNVEGGRCRITTRPSGSSQTLPRSFRKTGRGPAAQIPRNSSSVRDSRGGSYRERPDGFVIRAPRGAA